MRKAARAIIINDGKLIVMHRNKFGTQYATLPGGNIEMGESAEQALHRELAEEVCINYKNPKLVLIEHAGDPYGDQYIFLCEYVSGEPMLHPHSEEEQINKLGQNLYKPDWLSLETLTTTEFVSRELKEKILHYTKQGWQDTVDEFYSHF